MVNLVQNGPKRTQARVQVDRRWQLQAKMARKKQFWTKNGEFGPNWAKNFRNENGNFDRKNVVWIKDVKTQNGPKGPWI